jgi:adenylosuccinate lyase
MSLIWSDESRLSRWLEIELLATEAWAALGVVPADEARDCRIRAPRVDAAFVAAVNEREQVTDHDVAAFVDVVQAAVGSPAGNWIHYGLTSTDVVDTGQCLALVAACDLILAALDELVANLVHQARAHRDTPMMGRTHGMHAEPTTFGVKVALWALQVDRDRQRMRAARGAIAVGKLSGAVGTYSNIDPAIEAAVCRALGLTAVPATQIIARDRHAQFLYACASVTSSIEMFTTEVRHLQRTEVGEVLEGFRTGQKGSSAMPHKRNPILSERLTGIARIVRGHLGAALEDVALWHERDISHSIVERVILPDTSHLTYYAVRSLSRLVNNWEVHPERMLANLEMSHGLVFSQPALLALVAAGLTRDDAYRVVQEAARAAAAAGRPLRAVLEEWRDQPEAQALPALASVPRSIDLDPVFSLERSLSRIGAVFEAIDQL